MQLNPVTADFIDALLSKVPDLVIKENSERYREDPRNRYKGQDGLVLAPSKTIEVSNILQLCNQWAVPVVPYGGGTGLVGGQMSTGLPCPVIMSFERMNKIGKLNSGKSLITVDAGCSLQQVKTESEKYNRIFPLSLASKGSCQIGGNLATNAGGSNVVRYGNMRDLCFGIEAVFADGGIWNGLTGLRKDNRGYDLRNLIIGSEGTLAIITAACLKLFPNPVEKSVFMASVPNPTSGLKLFEMFSQKFGMMLTAFELISKVGIDFLKETEFNLKLPFDTNSDWLVLVDVGAESEFEIEDFTIDLLEKAKKQYHVADAWLAHSETQIQKFWEIRESIPVANGRIGSISSHDISLPLESVPEFISACGHKIESIGNFRVNCFGHLGDGNLHYNVFPPFGEDRSDYAEYQTRVRETVYSMVRDFGGSTTAEHGTGRRMASDLKKHESPAYMNAITAIKASLDPKGILNPGAVIEI